MDLGLKGKVALVAGASKGIGFGIARALAREGARVAISSRSRERIDAAAAEIGATGFVHDALDWEDVPRLVSEVEDALGEIDALVVNSGGPPGGPDPLGFTPDQWQDAYRELVLTPMAFIERVLPGMRRRGFGRVLNVSSSVVREPIPTLMLSAAHRTGTLAAFKTLAREAVADGVTVNTLVPGRIETDRLIETDGSMEAARQFAREHIPAGRLGTIDEMGAAAAFLCSEQAGYITGVALAVDGGLLRSI